MIKGILNLNSYATPEAEARAVAFKDLKNNIIIEQKVNIAKWKHKYFIKLNIEMQILNEIQSFDKLDEYKEDQEFLISNALSKDNGGVDEDEWNHFIENFWRRRK